MENNKINTNLLKNIAKIAGAFALIISVLLIVNYLQYKRIDPVETQLINTLVERLNENPEDAKLRDEIRALDLLARKAYFTNQWQIRTGGYLLLMSIAVLVITMQIIKSRSEKEIIVDEKENRFMEQKNARKWASISGAGIVSTALVFAFLTHNDLSTAFANAASHDSTKIITENPNIADNVNIEEETLVINNDSPPDNELEQSESDSIEISENSTDTIPEKALSEFPTYKEIIKNHPTFRGPGGNGISYHKNIPTSWNATSGKNVVWKLKIPLHGYNSPVIWDDKIFLSGASAAKREVYCIDRNSGKIIWTFDVKNIPGSPAASPKVTDDTGHAAPTVATDGRRVYAIFANGDIVALDMEGKKVWGRNLGVTGNHYGHSSSIMLYQNVLILQYDTKSSPKLMGLSTSTGKTIWSATRNVKISWASPVVVYTGKQTEILIAADPFVSSYNPYTGKENWKIDCIFGEVGPSVAYADGVVYAVNEYAKLAAIKIGEKPEILWENDEYLSDVPSPVATKSLLFMPTSYGAVVCYDSKTGEKYWEQEFDNGFYSSPMMVEGKIYLMDMKGIMHIFSASKKYISIGQSPIGEDGMTTPAFAEGKIYIRGNKHLFCIGK